MPEVPNDGPHFTAQVTTVSSEVTTVEATDVEYLAGDAQGLVSVVEIVGSAAIPVQGA